MFNAKIWITADNELRFERADKNDSTAKLVLPELLLEKPKTNASELISNYELAFLLDPSDDNTYDNYEGTATNALTGSNSGAAIIDLSSEGEGYKLVQLDIARATRKETLTDIQIRLNQLIKEHSQEIKGAVSLINSMSIVVAAAQKGIKKTINRFKLVGVRIPFDPKPIPTSITFDEHALEGRIGMLLISKDSISVDKIMSLDISTNPYNTKLKEDNSEIWHSGNLYDEHHFIQSHAATIDGVPFGNQYDRHELGDFSMCLADVIKVIDNNLTFTSDNRVAKIESLKWRQYDGIATKGRIRIRNVHDEFLETIVKTESGE
jgi:hypothetical protein